MSQQIAQIPQNPERRPTSINLLEHYKLGISTPLDPPISKVNDWELKALAHHGCLQVMTCTSKRETM
jgi:hypothetical protein